MLCVPKLSTKITYLEGRTLLSALNLVLLLGCTRLNLRVMFEVMHSMYVRFLVVGRWRRESAKDQGGHPPPEPHQRCPGDQQRGGYTRLSARA